MTMNSGLSICQYKQMSFQLPFASTRISKYDQYDPGLGFSGRDLLFLKVGEDCEAHDCDY